ncbi:isocitrate/isopropylmalate dehydrogenase [Phyllobacterium trifolii]|uniref:Isocitrate/isopropylmalate dehydrogenase n=1 Tax=Phyllobacterium trifolii TaxID=300193 RepID=A0A839UAH2_9HYPH|nr:isocitrate/isopropylmalate dehydrogenase [Phyllobacterium trifolii]
MKTHKIAAIPGDGIGKEVVAAGLRVLDACATRDGNFTVDVANFPWGSDFYKANGVLMPEGGIDELKAFDAILRCSGCTGRS